MTNFPCSSALVATLNAKHPLPRAAAHGSGPSGGPPGIRGDIVVLGAGSRTPALVSSLLANHWNVVAVYDKSSTADGVSAIRALGIRLVFGKSSLRPLLTQLAGPGGALDAGVLVGRHLGFRRWVSAEWVVQGLGAVPLMLV